MCLCGFSFYYWELIGLVMPGGATLGFLYVVSILVTLSALRNILFSKVAAYRKHGSTTQSMGLFAYKQTTTVSEFGSEEVQARGFIKMVYIIIFNQVINIMYLVKVLFA